MHALARLFPDLESAGLRDQHTQAGATVAPGIEVRRGAEDPAANAAEIGPTVGIVTLSYYGLFSAILHEAKPLKLRKAAIDNLARFLSEPS